MLIIIKDMIRYRHLALIIIIKEVIRYRHILLIIIKDMIRLVSNEYPVVPWTKINCITIEYYGDDTKALCGVEMCM